MPLDDGQIWVVTPAGTYTADSRATLDGLLETSLDYSQTVPGAWTSVSGELAWRVDQGVQLALSAMLLDTAPREGVVARALDAGITPGSAVPSRATVAPDGTGTLPEGTIVRGGGDDGMALWSVVSGFGAVTPSSEVTIEAEEGGATTLTNPTTLTLVTPVPGITALEYTGGALQVGRARQSTASLRVAVRRARNRRGGSAPGLRAAILEIPWVVAVSVAGDAGYVAIYVAPGPVGTDQEQELGDAIYAWTPAGCRTLGSSSVTVQGADGYDAVMRYTVGTTEAVDVVVTLTTDGLVSDASTTDAAEAVIDGIFAELSQGDTLYHYRAESAFATITGVLDAAVTLDGGTANIQPSTSADVLVVGTVTVTIA